MLPMLQYPMGPPEAYIYTFIIQGTLLLLITVRWIRWTQLRREVRADLLRGDFA
jgi:hypothetical protein